VELFLLGHIRRESVICAGAESGDALKYEGTTIPYCYKRETDRIAVQYYSRHRILFWLWDREEKDGDVSLDAVLGFTCDSTTSRYVKTSFLRGFFRYERDPEKGVSADFRFIPICRPPAKGRLRRPLAGFAQPFYARAFLRGFFHP